MLIKALQTWKLCTGSSILPRLRVGKSKETDLLQRLHNNSRNRFIPCLSIESGSDGGTKGATSSVHANTNHKETSNRGGKASSSGRKDLQVSSESQVRDLLLGDRAGGKNSRSTEWSVAGNSHTRHLNQSLRCCL
jgi:hypothetical protein